MELHALVLTLELFFQMENFYFQVENTVQMKILNMFPGYYLHMPSMSNFKVHVRYIG